MCFIIIIRVLRVEKETIGIHLRRLYKSGEEGLGASVPQKPTKLKKKKQIKWKPLFFDESDYFYIVLGQFMYYSLQMMLLRNMYFLKKT